MILKGVYRLPAILAAAATLALVAAGCGGDDTEEQSAISGVIADSIVTEDERLLCEELITPSYVEEIYGDTESCIEAEAPSPDDGEKPDEVIVSDIEIDGDSATATVEEVGGESDGATGLISVTNDGERWQVSGLGIDYLRSTLTQGLAGVELGTGDEESDAAFAACLDERLQELDDDSFRALAYESMADEEPNQDFMNAFADCVEETGATPGSDDAGTEEPTGSTDAPGAADGEPAGAPGGAAGGGNVSVIRQQFERGIAGSALADDVTREQIKCIIGELRSSITDEQIVDEVARGADNPSPELTAAVARAMANC